jgi:hypothetical protein
MTTVSGTQPLTAEELLSKSHAQVTGSADPNAPSQDGVLSAADLLTRAQHRAQGIIDPPVVQNISSSAKSLTPAKKDKPVPYTDQDWYIKAKVAQLKGQISLYSTLPGLDSSGAIMDSLTKQVNDLVRKQQAKLKESNELAAAKQKELDAANAVKDKSTSATDLLAKVRGTGGAAPLSDAVQALLDKAKQVNTLA